MTISVCTRMLLCVSYGMLLFCSHSEGYPTLFLAFGQKPLQQDTILRDTIARDTIARDTIKQDTVPQDTAQRMAKGVVAESAGVPLAGVTITIKGSDVKTQSDEQGAFEIKSPSDTAAMLVFSMLGFDTLEMPMSIANGQTVTLKPQDADENVLEEVVVIGYGTVQKENLTGSVSSLRGDAFQNNAITNAEDGIAGKIPGVRVSQGTGAPGKAANIKIRGLNSVTASSSPLYVIDGIPQDHMRNVNPRDIASMEVLKDASSGAIYGARGGNGVIVITTKSGVEGDTRVDFSSYAGFQQVDRFLPMMNTQEYTAYIRYLRDSRFQQTGGDLTAPVSSRPAEYQYPDSYLNPATLPDNDWQDVVYRRAPMQNYALNVSGGGKIGTFLLSGSYLRQDGVMHYTGFERYNLRANTNFNIGEKVKVGANVATSFNRIDDPETDGKESNAHYALAMPPVVAIDQNTEATGYSPAQTYVNPLARLREMTARAKANELQINTFADYTPIEGLTLRTQLGYISSHAAYNEFTPANVNKGAQANGYASSTDNYVVSIQNTATYRPDWGEDHILELLLGQGYEHIRQDILAAAGDGFANDLLPTLNNANNPTLASTSIGESATTSFFGRAQYHFRDRYLISISARYDGSSRFGPNSKWGLFPAASIGWKLNEEAFLEDVEWLSLLKIRASVGRAGNDRIGNYEHISLLGRQDYNLNGKLVTGLVPGNIANENLSWETTLSRDVGLDVWILDDRIQLTADAYFNKTSDLLLNVPISRVSGFSTIRQNIGEVENRGFELQITSQHIKTDDFSWTTSVNYSKNNNTVRSLAPGIDQLIMLTTLNDFNAYTTMVGHPLGSFYMYRTAGVLLPADFDETGAPQVPTINGQLEGNLKIVDVNNDGQINELDHTIVGNPQPDFLWGLSNRVAYKGFDLSFDIQGQQGGDVFYLGRRGFNNGLGEGTNQYRDWLHAYKPERFSANIPQGLDMAWDGETPSVVGINPAYNDTWIYDATFVRIRNITLGYNFAHGLLKKWNVGAVRLFVMADNLHTFTKYPGANPEANNAGGSGSGENTRPATDYGGYPISKRFSLGINVSF